MHDFGLVNLSLILLGALILILGSGVWIAVALGLIGLIAMLLTTSVPVGAVLATTVWSASASWTLAALPLLVTGHSARRRHPVRAATSAVASY